MERVLIIDDENNAFMHTEKEKTSTRD